MMIEDMNIIDATNEESLLDAIYRLEIEESAKDIYKQHEQDDKFKDWDQLTNSYIWNGSDEQYDALYKSRYGRSAHPTLYPNFLKIGLPSYVDSNVIQSIVWNNSEKILKEYGKLDKEKDYPFKYFRELTLDEKDLYNMIHEKNNRLLMTTKLYQYNFLKNNRRFSVLIIADNKTIHSMYLMIFDTCLVSVDMKNI